MSVHGRPPLATSLRGVEHLCVMFNLSWLFLRFRGCSNNFDSTLLAPIDKLIADLGPTGVDLEPLRTSEAKPRSREQAL